MASLGEPGAEGNELMAAHSHMGFRTSHFLFLFAIIIMGIVGVVKLAYATVEGVGISPDSTIYLGGAKNLRETGQLNHPLYQEPITHYPPLYSLLLAFCSYIEVNYAANARVINIFIYFLTILLGATLIYEVTDGHPLATLLGTALLISANDLLWVHMWAWTEPLFILLGFSSLLLLMKAISFQNINWLMVSAGLLGLSLLTRYAGITFLITSLISLIVFYPGKRIDKLKVISSYSIFALIPTVFWFFRNLLLTQNATNRDLYFHLITFEKLIQAAKTMGGWFITYPTFNLIPPVVINFLFITLIILILIVVFYYLIANKGELQIGKGIHLIVPVLSTFFLSYIIFLIISISIVDAHTPLNDRILAPAYFAVIPILIFYIYRIIEELSPSKVANQILTTLIVGLVSLIVFLNWTDQMNWVMKVHREGLGYNSERWKSSETIKYIASLPDDVQIISNAPDALYFLTGKITLFLPRKYNTSTLKDNKLYSQEMEVIRENKSSPGTYLVFFKNIHRNYLPTEDELVNMFTQDNMKSFSDGNVYIFRKDG